MFHTALSFGKFFFGIVRRAVADTACADKASVGASEDSTLKLRTRVSSNCASTATRVQYADLLPRALHQLLVWAQCVRSSKERRVTESLRAAASGSASSTRRQAKQQFMLRVAARLKMVTG